MRPYRGSVWGCALVVLAAGGGETQAAWDNVFQTCCWSCNKPAPAVAAYYEPARRRGGLLRSRPVRSPARRATSSARTTNP